MKSGNVYEESFMWIDFFEFSNCSKDWKFFDETNKKVIGKIKDKIGGIIVNDFAGLKLQMYSTKKM